jgi:cell division transport system ATP-binding protein
MIRFTHTSKRYTSGYDALRNISFHMPPGQMAFLTGHSGAGKSTLLKLIALLERSSRGQIFINGQNLAKISRRRIPYFRRNIGIIFQDHQLLFDRTVFDNVALPLIIAGEPQREIGKRVRAALDKVGLLGKEKKPPLLLADEPTGNLDPDLSRDIMHLFEEFSQVGVTVLIASHDLALIHTLPYRVLTLRQGQLINDTDPSD